MIKWWFILFVSAHNGGAGLGAPTLMMGPFPTKEYCAGMGALGIDRLNRDNEGKDFRGACVRDSEILPLQELATMAGAPLAVEK